MFDFPQTTYFGKLIPKTKFYDKLTIDKKVERSFIDQIASVRWVHKLSADTLNVEKGSIVDEVEVYHRTVSTLINSMIRAGFIIEECQESRASDELREKYPDKFGGTIHRPEFIFFRCRKQP